VRFQKGSSLFFKEDILAGSYLHCVDQENEGQFTIDLLDHMGDAGGALEQMFFMIGYLSNNDEEKIKGALASYYVLSKSKSEHDKRLFEKFMKSPFKDL